MNLIKIEQEEDWFFFLKQFHLIQNINVDLRIININITNYYNSKPFDPSDLSLDSKFIIIIMNPRARGTPWVINKTIKFTYEF